MNGKIFFCVFRKIEKEIKERRKHSLQTLSRMLLFLSWLFLPLCIFKAATESTFITSSRRRKWKKNFLLLFFLFTFSRWRSGKFDQCDVKIFQRWRIEKKKMTDGRQSISVGIYACHHLVFSVNPLTFVMIHNCEEVEVNKEDEKPSIWMKIYKKCGKGGCGMG